MLVFNIVKKIGEGKYLDEDCLIIERVRKERALNMGYVKVNIQRYKTRIPIKNERPNSS